MAHEVSHQAEPPNKVEASPSDTAAASDSKFRFTSAEGFSLCFSAVAVALSLASFWYQVRADDDLRLSVVSVQRSERDRSLRVQVAAVNQGNRRGVVLSIQPWMETVNKSSSVSLRMQDLEPSGPIVVEAGGLAALEFSVPLTGIVVTDGVQAGDLSFRLILCLRVLDSRASVDTQNRPMMDT